MVEKAAISGVKSCATSKPVSACFKTPFPAFAFIILINAYGD